MPTLECTNLLAYVCQDVSASYSLTYFFQFITVCFYSLFNIFCKFVALLTLLFSLHSSFLIFLTEKENIYIYIALFPFIYFSELLSLTLLIFILYTNIHIYGLLFGNLALFLLPASNLIAKKIPFASPVSPQESGSRQDGRMLRSAHPAGPGAAMDNLTVLRATLSC